MHSCVGPLVCAAPTNAFRSLRVYKRNIMRVYARVYIPGVRHITHSEP